MATTFADCVQEMSATSGVGSFVLSGVVAGGAYRTFGSKFAAGDKVRYHAEKGAQWEVGIGTLTDATHISRDVVLSSSNNDQIVTFLDGTMAISEVLSAYDIMRFAGLENDVVTSATAGSVNMFLDDGSAKPKRMTLANFATLLSSVGGASSARTSVDSDVAFSQSIPLTQVGVAWMAVKTVTAALAFTPAANAVKGATVFLRLTADGTSAITFPGFKRQAGNDYINTAGQVNLVEFTYDGVDYWYAVSQQAGSVSGPDTVKPTMNGSLSSANITQSGFDLSWSQASDNIGVTGYEVSINGGSGFTDVGLTYTKSFSSLIANTDYPCQVRAYDAAGNRAATPLALTVHTSVSSDTTLPVLTGTLSVTNIGQTSYTMSWPAGSDNIAVAGYEYSTDGGTNYNDVGNTLTKTVNTAVAGTQYQLRVRCYDAAGLRSTPALAASVTTVSATAPDAPTIGTVSAGDTVMTVNWTAPANNGGSAITGYTISVYNASTNALITTASAGANATSATVSGLTNNVQVYAKVAATNGIGTGAQSAQSTNVTPVAADWPRCSSLTAAPNGSMTESGTGPYVYTGGGSSVSVEKGGLGAKKIAAGTNGWLEFECVTPNEILVGFRTVASTNIYSSQAFCTYLHGASGSQPLDYRLTGGAALAYTPTAGDKLRIARTGNNFIFQLNRGGTITDMATVNYGSSPDVWFDVICTNTAAVRLLAWSGVV